MYSSVNNRCTAHSLKYHPSWEPGLVRDPTVPPRVSPTPLVRSGLAGSVSLLVGLEAFQPCAELRAARACPFAPGHHCASLLLLCPLNRVCGSVLSLPARLRWYPPPSSPLSLLCLSHVWPPCLCLVVPGSCQLGPACSFCCELFLPG